MNTNTLKKLDDFLPGQKVTYIPNHAGNNEKHADCEHGIVSSVGIKFVFVRYYNRGILKETAQATDPTNLVLR